MRTRFYLLAIGLGLAASAAPGGEWVRAGLNTNQPIWGLRGGLLWAIPPGGFPSPGGPRGLLRVGYPIASNGACRLVNFIAIEPIVAGKRGFSELEWSQSDQMRGKRIWALAGTNLISPSTLTPGTLVRGAGGVERCEVGLRVERFENGAQVRLVVSQSSFAPDEIGLSIFTEPGSAPLDCCVLSATMGNLARTRLLWLRDEVVGSLELYASHRDDGFAPHQVFALDRLARTAEGDALAALTTDERDPASVFPFPGSERWHYGGFKVTQYWRQRRADVRDDLQAAVNARYTYWQSRQPIPGGVAFENFELRERFCEGQTFVFGITPKTPIQLGLRGRVGP